MSVQEMSFALKGENFVFTNCLLGTIAMFCSPMLYVASTLSPQNFGEPNPQQILASLLGVIYLSGIMASVIAMRKVRVTGKGIGAAILYVVQLTGLCLAIMYDILSYAAPHLKQSTFFFIADMAYPFSHVLMIIVGIAIIRAGVWRGWCRIPAFLCGLGLPLFLASSAVFGRENSGWIFIIGVPLGFFLLGYAVRTSK